MIRINALGERFLPGRPGPAATVASSAARWCGDPPRPPRPPRTPGTLAGSRPARSAVTRARSETGQATASRADNHAYSDPSDALFELIDNLRLIPATEEDLDLMPDGVRSTQYSNGFDLALVVETAVEILIGQ